MVEYASIEEYIVFRDIEPDDLPGQQLAALHVVLLVVFGEAVGMQRLPLRGGRVLQSPLSPLPLLFLFLSLRLQGEYLSNIVKERVLNEWTSHAANKCSTNLLLLLLVTAHHRTPHHHQAVIHFAIFFRRLFIDAFIPQSNQILRVQQLHSHAILHELSSIDRHHSIDVQAQQTSHSAPLEDALSYLLHLWIVGAIALVGVGGAVIQSAVVLLAVREKEVRTLFKRYGDGGVALGVLHADQTGVRVEEPLRRLAVRGKHRGVQQCEAQRGTHVLDSQIEKRCPSNSLHIRDSF